MFTNEYKMRFHAKHTLDGKGDDSCWLWVASVDKQWGYGWFKHAGKMRKAHRVSWEIHNGEIPPDKIVCHHCDVPACVNPSHLYIGTHQQNSDDKFKRGRVDDRRGEKNGKARFTEADILAIRADTRTQAVIAAEWGVAQGQISAIKTRKTWKHI